MVDRLNVEMAEAPFVDGDVPLAPELVDGCGVPPVLVEAAVSEASELRGEAEEAVEEGVEAEKPHEQSRDSEVQDVNEGGEVEQPTRVLALEHDWKTELSDDYHYQQRAHTQS